MKKLLSSLHSLVCVMVSLHTLVHVMGSLHALVSVMSPYSEFVCSRKILKHLAKSWVLHANIFTIYLKAFINE